MTGNVTLFKPEAPPVRPGHVETETTRAIHRALRRAQLKEKMTLVAGAPGIGKTEALWSYFNQQRDTCFFYKATSGEGGVYNLACGLCEMLEIPRPKCTDLAASRRRLAERIGVSSLLIIDEAQYLVQRNLKRRDNPEALDWIRGVAEDGCFGVALVGDLSLRDAVKEMPQLDRRTHPRVVVEYVPQEDVEALCNAHGLTNAKIVEALARKARRLGGLGYVSEVLSDARDMSDTGTPKAEDYLFAMKLFEEGCRQ